MKMAFLLPQVPLRMHLAFSILPLGTSYDQLPVVTVLVFLVLFWGGL